MSDYQVRLVKFPNDTGTPTFKEEQMRLTKDEADLLLRTLKKYRREKAGFRIQFKRIDMKSIGEYCVHFSIKRLIQTKEYELVIKAEDGRAVEIKSGSCINSDGWFDWDEAADEEELLEIINSIFEKDLKVLDEAKTEMVMTRPRSVALTPADKEGKAL